MLDEAADDRLIALQCSRPNTEQHDVQRGYHLGSRADFHREWRKQDFLQDVARAATSRVAGLARLPSRMARRLAVTDFALTWWV
jgi:hypothetical protein